MIYGRISWWGIIVLCVISYYLLDYLDLQTAVYSYNKILLTYLTLIEV